MYKNAKVGLVVATSPDSKQKTLINAGALLKAFDVSNSNGNAEKIQCHKCNPPPVEPRGKMRLCPDCETETRQSAETLLENFQQHRKIIKLDRFCACCEKRKASAMMSKIIPDICRRCAEDLKTKGAAARNNFIARAVNNYFRNLKRAVTI